MDGITVKQAIAILKADERSEIIGTFAATSGYFHDPDEAISTLRTNGQQFVDIPDEREKFLYGWHKAVRDRMVPRSS